MERERQICEQAVIDYSKYLPTDHIGYEVTYFKKVASEFGRPPQDIINEDWKGFDLYIGIMGNRFGTPTQNWDSGTEEEFRIALSQHEKNSNVSVSLLFSNAEIAITGMTNEQIKQFLAVRAFKENISSLGVYQTFSNDRELLNNVNQILKKHASEQSNIRSANEYQYQLLAEIPNIDVFRINEKFFKECLDNIGAEISNSQKAGLRLGEMYIPLDLTERSINDDDVAGNIVISSDSLYLNQDSSSAILSGDEKSGRTTFCKMAYRSLHKSGFVPVLLNGSQIKNVSDGQIEKLVERGFTEQYSDGALPRYKTLPKSKKVLLIDDLDESSLNHKFQLRTLSDALNAFERIYVTVDTNWIFNVNMLGSSDLDQLSSFSVYDFEDMGHTLQDKMIQKWVSAGRADTIDSESLYHDTERNKSVVDGILSTNCVPRRPFYLLVILQAVQAGTSNKLTHSSYVRYYQHLIDSVLLKGAPQTRIELYYAFLPVIAHSIFQSESKMLTEEAFSSLIVDFSERYGIEASELNDIRSTLLFLEILRLQDSRYVFKHSYTFYFFLGQYFSDRIHDRDVKDEIENICDNLHLKQNANIIIFTSYHTNDPVILEKISKIAESLFEGVDVFDVKSGPASMINKLVSEGPKIILASRADEKRKELLASQDNYDRRRDRDLKQDIDKSELDEMDFSAHAHLAHRTAEILGQLLKNHHMRFEAQQKKELYLRTINLGLRCLNVLIESVSENQEALVNLFNSRVPNEKRVKKENERKLAEKAIFNYCHYIVGGFIKTLSNFTGSDLLAKTYHDVLSENDKEIYSLIDFSIKLDVSSAFPIGDLDQVKKKFEANFLATSVLRSLVRHRLYMKPVAKADIKQRICDKMGITMEEGIQLSQKGKKRSS